MKKLIALSAATVFASSAAIADIALSGSASVSYDDNGSLASSTTYDADLSIVGTSGATTVTITMDMDASAAITGVDLATSIGPVSIAADMFNEDETNNNDGDGDYLSDSTEPDDRSVTVSLDVPVGDVTIALDDSGDVTASGTFAGVTISHTMSDGDDTTSASASIAGIDVTIENDEGTTAWDLATTVSGVALTLDSDNDVSATMGLAGNELTVTHNAAVAYTAATATKFDTAAAESYTTVAVTRDLTSGATLTATYSSSDDSLTLKAAVSF